MYSSAPRRCIVHGYLADVTCPVRFRLREHSPSRERDIYIYIGPVVGQLFAPTLHVSLGHVLQGGQRQLSQLSRPETHRILPYTRASQIKLPPAARSKLRGDHCKSTAGHVCLQSAQFDFSNPRWVQSSTWCSINSVKLEQTSLVARILLYPGASRPSGEPKLFCRVYVLGATLRRAHLVVLPDSSS